MPEIFAHPPTLSCYRLFPGPRILDFNCLTLIPFRLASPTGAGGLRR